MAGDWIKMRIELQTHPKVFRMVSALQADRLRIIGGLHIAWSIFDTHCDDGVLVGYTTDAMDAVIGWPGFTQAMIDVEWAALDDTGSLVMPRFDEHNGKSAKRRANDNERKRNTRNGESVRNMSASDADKKRTREEKRREDKDQKPFGDDAVDPAELFARFWALYPRKVSKDAARKAWDKLDLSAELFEAMIQALGAQSLSVDWTKDNGQFIPHASTWLNGKRWEDEVPAPAPTGSNVHQLRPQRQANGPDFDDQTWANDIGGGL
ncbi:Pyocin large subunit-like protein [Pseudomonas sp. TH31]|uniref:Pyocin large subunit-like protein n=1 Tax=Pseudomonas sp. TH31 TaxID=2796396 RepID=UPI0019129085|nr:Pyocin large subunit-like protein [Pseudomonas sp. TH31]MBK5416371.1 Pyocin large subunit-like protein [Pseudomonas sp. TH31]